MWGTQDDRGGKSTAGRLPRTAVSGEGDTRRCDYDVFPFKTAFVQRLLKNKYIYIIGDSNIRGLYKDIVVLLQQDRTLDEGELKGKCEPSFNNDHLTYRTMKTNNTTFVELREYCTPYHRVEYCFTTRCYNHTIETIMQQWQRRKLFPDIVIMNSTLWDISRYLEEVTGKRDYPGEKTVEARDFEYVQMSYACRLHTMMRRMRAILPAHAMTLWLTCPPVASQIVGGFLGDEVNVGEDGDGLKMRVTVLDANNVAAQCATYNGWDVCDINFYMVPFCSNWRLKDGVHWVARGYRHMTSLILLFIADAMRQPLPAPHFTQYLRELRIEDPNADSGVHPMEALAPRVASIDGNYEQRSQPSWFEPMIEDALLPAFLVARTRLVHMRQYLRRTGIDADRLRHLLLFGHPTRTPLDDAMDNSKPNTHDRLPPIDGVRVVTGTTVSDKEFLDADILYIDADTAPTLAFTLEEFRRVKFDATKCQASVVDGAARLPKIDGANEQTLSAAADDWIEKVCELDNEKDSDFEQFAINYTARLLSVYGLSRVQDLFTSYDDPQNIDSSPPIKKTKLG